MHIIDGRHGTKLLQPLSLGEEGREHDLIRVAESSHSPLPEGGAFHSYTLGDHSVVLSHAGNMRGDLIRFNPYHEYTRSTSGYTVLLVGEATRIASETRADGQAGMPSKLCDAVDLAGRLESIEIDESQPSAIHYYKSGVDLIQVLGEKFGIEVPMPLGGLDNTFESLSPSNVLIPGGKKSLVLLDIKREEVAPLFAEKGTVQS